MDKKSSSACYRQFIRIITFIDLPINRKFALFSLGVIFWLLALATVAVVTLIRVDATYGHILRETIPHQQAAQKITAELATINLEISDLYQVDTSSEVLSHSNLLLTRLDEIHEITSNLVPGDENLVISEGEVISNGNPAESAAGGSTYYLHKLVDVIDELSRVIRQVSAEKVEQLQSGTLGGGPDTRSNEMKALLRSAEALSLAYDAQMAGAYRRSTGGIDETIRNSFFIMFAVLFLALILLAIFTRWISGAIADPIRAITGQIHSLSTGDVDLSEKIAITSQDEIGLLAAEFNGLMESVYGMNAFKNVIEEDAHLQDIYLRLGDIFARVAQIDSYCIYEIKDNQHEMAAVYPPGLQDEELHCQTEILVNCDLCRARKTGHTISSLDYPGICQQFRARTEGQQHVCVPVNVGGRIGVIVQFLFAQSGAAPLDRATIQRQVERAIVYLKEAQSVLEAKRLLSTLRDSALKDALTGLYNRRFLQEHSQKIVAACQRRGTSIGLLMCDLDYFKQVNDKFGHETGDLMLRETALSLIRTVRESDYVIRFGGEEFLVLLIDVEEGEADLVAEKIRLAVAGVSIKTNNGPLSKTISIGVSVFPADGEAFWQTIKFADVALYKAKDAGRDCVVHFEKEMWSGESF